MFSSIIERFPNCSAIILCDLVEIQQFHCTLLIVPFSLGHHVAAAVTASYLSELNVL